MQGGIWWLLFSLNSNEENRCSEKKYLQKTCESRAAVPGLLVFAHLVEAAQMLCSDWDVDALAHPSPNEKDGSWKQHLIYLLLAHQNTAYMLIFIILINIRFILCYKS